jgi:hypothetical protein
MPPCRRVLICGGVSEEALNAGLDDGLNARLNAKKNLVRTRTFRPGRDQEAPWLHCVLTSRLASGQLLVAIDDP